MDDELLTDEQEAARARQWLRENGGFIAAGIVLGLGGLFGWQYWQDYQTSQAGSASVVWEQLRSAITGERFNEVNETLELLESDYANSPYLDQARLALAKTHMERNDVAAAAEQLGKLATTGSDPYLSRLGELRLAQILLFQEQYDEALTTLGAADETALAALYYELQGDVYYAQGHFEDARNAYEAALAQGVPGVIDRAFVQMKLDDVSGVSQALTQSAPPVTDEILGELTE